MYLTGNKSSLFRLPQKLFILLFNCISVAIRMAILSIIQSTYTWLRSAFTPKGKLTKTELTESEKLWTPSFTYTPTHLHWSSFQDHGQLLKSTLQFQDPGKQLLQSALSLLLRQCCRTPGLLRLSWGGSAWRQTATSQADGILLSWTDSSAASAAAHSLMALI